MSYDKKNVHAGLHPSINKEGDFLKNYDDFEKNLSKIFNADVKSCFLKPDRRAAIGRPRTAREVGAYKN